MKLLKNITILGVIVMLLCGCSIENDDMENINIYTTTYPINYLISSLYQKSAKVFSIYPTGVDINTYKI